ncbi:MAG: hypothetical protein KDD47_16125, partial [Acidobacteria bacterium]|nr:hypothetical protein [Acidobacteriota bacterium]
GPNGRAIIDPGLDLVAVYGKLEGESLRLRVDFLDLAPGPLPELWVEVDFLEGGEGGSAVAGLEACAGWSWDLLARLHPDGSFEVHTAGALRDTPLVGEGSIHRDLDFVEVRIPVGEFAPSGGTPLRVRAATLDEEHRIVDWSPCLPSRGRASLGVVFNNLFHGESPGASTWYEGCFPDRRADPTWCQVSGPQCPDCCSPGGPRYLLDAVECYGTPVTIHDLHMEMLPGLEYLGIARRLRELQAAGLLDLPDTLSYGYFMPWQASEVDRTVIRLAQEMRRRFLDSVPPRPRDVKAGSDPRDWDDSPRLFSPYEAMVRAEDLCNLQQAGYDGILGLAYYGSWFDEPGEEGSPVSPPEAHRARVEETKKIQDVTLEIPCGEEPTTRMKVLFVPESFGIDTDSRWRGDPWSFDDDQTVPAGARCDTVYAMMLGTDGGLHLNWRKGLLDQAVSEDPNKYFNIGADLQLTPMLFPEVIRLNLRWLAAHPWIEPTTYSDLLRRGAGDPSWLVDKTVERVDEAKDLLPYPRCGEEQDYNTYFPIFYDGEDAGELGPRWSCFVPCGERIEGYAQYRPFVRSQDDAEVFEEGDLRMGGYCPDGCGGGMGPGCEAADCRESVVHKTLSALLSELPASPPLLELAWQSYLVTIAEQTAHQGQAHNDACTGERAKLPAGQPCGYGVWTPPPGCQGVACDPPDGFPCGGAALEYGGARLNEKSKLQANFMGNVNEVVAAARWAACYDSGAGNSCVVSESCTLDLLSLPGVASCDLDFDGENEPILYNDSVFAVFEQGGGRLESAFLRDGKHDPVQAVAPLSQHYGLIQANAGCGDPAADCYRRGETDVGEGGRLWGGAFGEILSERVQEDGEDRYRLVVDFRHLPFTASSDDDGITFVYADGTGTRVSKTFRLESSAIVASYEIEGLRPSDGAEWFGLDIGFGLPVDLGGMFQPISWRAVEEVGDGATALGWRVNGRAQALVSWSSPAAPDSPPPLWAMAFSYTQSPQFESAREDGQGFPF